MQDLIEGAHSYPGLMTRLQVGLARALVETGLGRLGEVFEARLS
jgi:hypothetical protein